MIFLRFKMSAKHEKGMLNEECTLRFPNIKDIYVLWEKQDESEVSKQTKTRRKMKNLLEFVFGFVRFLYGSR